VLGKNGIGNGGRRLGHGISAVGITMRRIKSSP
jgi:hypothetical protein